MRWLILCLVLLLAACPAGKGAKSQTQSPAAGRGKSSQAATLAWPAPAVAYFKECLATPANDTHPPFGPIWKAIARLPGFTPLAEEITLETQKVGIDSVHELVQAWLAVDEKAAEAWLSERLNQQDLRCLMALEFAPQVGRRLLKPEMLASADDPTRGKVLDLIRAWGGAEAADAPLLKAIAGSTVTPAGLRAVGYLLALGQATSEQTAQVKEALKSKEMKLFVPAIEAVRLSGDAAWANDLVPLVAQAEVGEEVPYFTGEPRILFASYALTYLPGDQAKLLRTKLLGAKAPLLRWQARLGELLHGDAGPWTTAIAGGVDAQELWTALEPPEVAAPELLATYQAAAKSKNPEVRAKAAQYLNRYAGSPSQAEAVKILTTLILDGEPVVKEQAWYTLGKLGQAPSDPLVVVVNDAEAPPVRLAAAWCACELARQKALAGSRSN